MQSSKLSPAAAATELLRRRRARTSLVDYARTIDIPGKPVEDGDDDDKRPDWLFRPIETSMAAHHVLLLEAAQRCMEQRHGRLMAFMPPGSAKSTYLSVVCPTWAMGRWPGFPVILGSYATPLAKRHGRRARQIVKQPRYRAIWSDREAAHGPAVLRDDQGAAHEWGLETGSSYLAGGLLSGITGNRARGLIIDDPIKGREQADSQVIRDKTWEAYNDDLLTRLIPGAWVMLVQTRWHEDDLAGRLLPKGYKGQSGIIRCRDGFDWHVLNLPAQCEREDDPLGREIGAYLWPEWFDEKHWSLFKTQPRTWAALYQQRPAPAEGVVFLREWFRVRYRAIPPEARLVVHSWDTAQKARQRNDYSVGGAFVTEGAAASRDYLREVYRAKVEYPALRQVVVDMANRDRPVAVLIEDKGHGTALIQELRNTTRVPVVAIEPEGDKVLRACEEAPACQSGRVLLPEEAAWLPEFEGELFGFPDGVAHDDQVDMLSQYLKWRRNWTGKLVSYGAGLVRASLDGQVHTSDEGYGSVGHGARPVGF